MKRLLVFCLVIAGAITVGCSGDDDANTLSMQAIIGTWRQNTVVTNGQEQVLDECDLHTTMTLTSAGGYIANVFYSDPMGGNCGHATANGTWSHNESTITINVAAGSETYLVAFPDLNTMELTNNNDEGFTSVITFKRVE